MRTILRDNTHFYTCYKQNTLDSISSRAQQCVANLAAAAAAVGSAQAALTARVSWLAGLALRAFRERERERTRHHHHSADASTQSTRRERRCSRNQALRAFFLLRALARRLRHYTEIEWTSLFWLPTWNYYRPEDRHFTLSVWFFSVHSQKKKEDEEKCFVDCSRYSVCVRVCL